MTEIQHFYLKQLKIAYFKHSEHFAANETFENQNLLQITVNTFKTGHNNMIVTSVEQKLA